MKRNVYKKSLQNILSKHSFVLKLDFNQIKIFVTKEKIGQKGNVS